MPVRTKKVYDDYGCYYVYYLTANYRYRLYRSLVAGISEKVLRETQPVLRVWGRHA